MCKKRCWQQPQEPVFSEQFPGLLSVRLVAGVTLLTNQKPFGSLVRTNDGSSSDPEKILDQNCQRLQFYGHVVKTANVCI